jgi:hypothetical protein
MNLEYLALGLLIFVMIFIFYGIIAIHDIPYEIAKKRNHPHLDAIHVAGWVSLFTLHVLWPFLWIWATLYRPERGWGFAGQGPESEATGDFSGLQLQLAEITQRLDALENTDETQEVFTATVTDDTETDETEGAQ